jgi:UDPglucose 6-dehydrogenase
VGDEPDGTPSEEHTDVADVARGMGSDTRIGERFLTPGPGWGGSCFPKDTMALLHTAGSVGLDFTLIQAAVDTNEAQLDRVADKVRRAAGGSLLARKIAVWGLTFKAGTDDLRCSPAIAVIDRLRAEGAHISAYDPTVFEPMLGIDIVADPYSACWDADVLVILTEWRSSPKPT